MRRVPGPGAWFFQDVINWDESVFILVGQAWADGHLPHTVTWDNKPPLGFGFFAFVVALVPLLAALLLIGAPRASRVRQFAAGALLGGYWKTTRGWTGSG